MVEMQTYVISCSGIDGSAAVLFPFTTKANHLLLGGRRCGRRSRRSAPPPVAAAAADHSQDHYAVLGLSSRASSADIKRAYRLLALKYHPDVSKDLQADKVFKSIRIAYEVLSNEKARAQYDDALRFQEGISQPWGRSGTEDIEFDEGLRIYRWYKLRQRMRNKWQYDATDENSSYNEADAYEEGSINERGSFSEVLRFAFLALFFMHTLGPKASLTLCGLSAFLDKQLDGGYKLGYVVAWALGGRSGILLTLCLSFATWLCGKSSSSLVVLVVIAMWVGVNVARFAPIPRGALLTLLYMSMKLQVGLR